MQCVHTCFSSLKSHWNCPSCHNSLRMKQSFSAVQSTTYVEEFLPVPLSTIRLGPPSPPPTYRSPSLFLPHAEIPQLLLCSYLCILLQMKSCQHSLRHYAQGHCLKLCLLTCGMRTQFAAKLDGCHRNFENVYNPSCLSLCSS